MDPSLKLFMRERRPKAGRAHSATPLLLVHGATLASVLWDNPHKNWSWMNRLAADGLHVFALDLRGYGRSTRPDCFDEPADNNPPYARATAAQQDVHDAINYILEYTSASEVDLLGGSWGSVVCGKLVSETDDVRVRRLVLYAPIYCQPDERPNWLDNNTSPNTPDIGAYRHVSLEQLRKRWDEEIPVPDKSAWRPYGVLESMVRNCLDEEMLYSGSGSESFRVPNGTISDLHQVFGGNALYECKKISAPVLLIRGSHDPVSTHDDVSALFGRIGSEVKRYTIIGNGAHFMIAERKFGEVHQTVKAFLLENL